METKDSLSRPLLTEDDGINMLLHDVELVDNEFVETEDVKMYNLHCGELDLFALPLLGKEIDKDLFDAQRQREWYIPKHYKELDIVEYVAKLCPNDNIRQQRVAEELYEYQARNLLDMLRCLVYIIDTMRKHDIVWGVGRGSSVASYVLYLLGVHKVDSVKYNIDLKEFFK